MRRDTPSGSSLALINPAPPVDPDEQVLFYSDLRGRLTPEQRARVEDSENRKLYENSRDPEEFREYYSQVLRSLLR